MCACRLTLQYKDKTLLLTNWLSAERRVGREHNYRVPTDHPSCDTATAGRRLQAQPMAQPHQATHHPSYRIHINPHIIHTIAATSFHPSSILSHPHQPTHHPAQTTTAAPPLLPSPHQHPFRDHTRQRTHIHCQQQQPLGDTRRAQRPERRTGIHIPARLPNRSPCMHPSIHRLACWPGAMPTTPVVSWLCGGCRGKWWRAHVVASSGGGELRWWRAHVRTRPRLRSRARRGRARPSSPAGAPPAWRAT